MGNIFEGAKFCDKFLTKSGIICIYWGIQIAYDLPGKSMFPYQVIFDNGMGMYNEQGIFCTEDENYNIVSRYQ